ncbi:TPA: transglutaminase domain-containing protein [archaeon]|nr:transglutaminase domain-containing protein [Candidatus Naiadarchaeales archaeon SRR2090153.bin461]
MLVARIPIIAVCALMILPAITFAAIDAQKVSYLRAEVVQDVHVRADGSPSEVTVDVLIPQEDDFQTIESQEVSIPFTTKVDDMGNKMVSATFDNPDNLIEFKITSIVNVKRRTSASLPQNPALLRSTDLIESKDEKINKLAEEITAGKQIGFEQISAVAGWVNENTKYDLAYADVNLSASQVLDLGAGVCDEFSTLELSMLRSLGYRSAYIVGYAYGRGYRQVEDFVPHGWTEVCSPDGGCTVADPTWAEVGWLDAMHIKFATLVNSGNYIEATALAKGYGSNLKVMIDGVNTTIKILQSDEEASINSESILLDDNVWSGYAVVKTDLSADGCLLTKVSTNSCTLDGKGLLTPLQPESIVSFCDEKTIFSLFKIPDTLDQNTRYSCSLGTGIGGNGAGSNSLALESSFDSTAPPQLSLDKTSLKPGEEFVAASSGSHIFTDFGSYGQDNLIAKAPSQNFKVYAYDNGQLTEQEVLVSEYRPLEVKIAVNDTVLLGNVYSVNITVQNVEDSSRQATVIFGNRSVQSLLSAGQSKVFHFNFTAFSKDDNVVRTFVSTNGFSTSVSKTVDVIKQASFGNFIADTIQAIIDFFKRLFGGLK